MTSVLYPFAREQRRNCVEAVWRSMTIFGDGIDGERGAGGSEKMPGTEIDKVPQTMLCYVHRPNRRSHFNVAI